MEEKKLDFFFKGKHFKSHSQFANRCSGFIVLNQHLATHTVGLRGTEFNSKISIQLTTVLILHFLKISFWMLEEIEAKKVKGLMAGYGYIHPGAGQPSKPFTSHRDRRVRFNHAHSDHALTAIHHLMQDEASQVPAQQRWWFLLLKHSLSGWLTLPPRKLKEALKLRAPQGLAVTTV